VVYFGKQIIKMNYEQKTGRLTDSKGSIMGVGYSGNGQGKNNPLMQDVKNVGVIPRGKYMIGNPYDSPHTGAFTLPLIPDPTNKMFGRNEFKIHGDNISAPGTASQGCIILPRIVRIAINNSSDKYINVI